MDGQTGLRPCCSQYPEDRFSHVEAHLMQVKSIPLEHSAILLTFIKPPFVIKIFVLSIFEWLETGLIVCFDNLSSF